MELARKIERRIMLRFLLSRDRFDAVRRKNPSKRITDVECFLNVISGTLSEGAKKLLDTARNRQGRYNKLLRIAKRSSKGNTITETEATRLKAIVDFEVTSNKRNKNWTFAGGGLMRLSEDFFLLNEHLTGSQSNRINQFCTQWGRFALDKDAKNEIDQIPEPSRNEKLIKKVRPLLEPLWAFFVALCHALQEGENDLTSTDAFWLGLVDEVMGEKDLPSLRYIAEFRADPPEPPQAEKAASPVAEDVPQPPTAAGTSPPGDMPPSP
jgi:hypothetical protein